LWLPERAKEKDCDAGYGVKRYREACIGFLNRPLKRYGLEQAKIHVFKMLPKKKLLN